jgi:uncharacterized membrane protein YkoI
MKISILVFAASIIISVTACAQTSKDLPLKVKTAFGQKFPAAQNVKWSKENGTEWEAEFKVDAKEYSANFNSEGLWIETEYEISAGEIPAAVTQTLNKEFPGYKLLESEISETSKGKVYEFEIKSGSKKTEVALDENGDIKK